MTDQEIDGLVQAGRIDVATAARMKEREHPSLAGPESQAPVEAQTAPWSSGPMPSIAQESPAAYGAPAEGFKVPYTGPPPQRPLSATPAPPSTVAASMSAPIGAFDGGLGRIDRELAARTKRDDETAAKRSDEYGAAIARGKMVVGEAADIEAKKAEELHSRRRIEEKAYAADQAANDQDEIGRKHALDATAKELRTLQEEAAAATVDPDRRPLAAKIIATIGIAISEYASILGGTGRNTALQIVQDSIDRDIAAQREEIASKRGAVSDKRNELAEMRQRFGDDRMAADAMAAKRYGQAINIINEDVLAKYDNPQIIANANKVKGELDVKRLEHEESIIQQANDNYIKNLNLRAQLTAQRVDANLKAEELGIESAANKATQQGNELAQIGYVGHNPDKEIRKQAIDMAGGALATQRIVSDIKNDLVGPNGVGSEIFPTAAAKKVQSKALMLMTALRKAGAMGTLDSGSIKFLGDMVGGDMTGYRTSAVIAKLDGVLEAQNIMMGAELEARGYRPAVIEQAPVEE